MNGKNILEWESEQSNWHQAVSRITRCAYVRAHACLLANVGIQAHRHLWLITLCKIHTHIYNPTQKAIQVSFE